MAAVELVQGGGGMLIVSTIFVTILSSALRLKITRNPPYHETKSERDCGYESFGLPICSHYP